MGYRAWLSDSKVMALVAAMVMMLSLGVTAWAAGPETVPEEGTGTITIYNAARGETYKVYKVLDAKVGANGAIVYPGPVPKGLEECFELSEDGVNLQGIDGLSDQALFAKLKAWAEAEGREAATDPIVAGSETVVFEGLEFGYYVVTSSQGDGANVMITSTAPDAEIYEKNVTEPNVTKTAEDSYSIGDEITYTVEFNGANYRGAGEDAEIVTAYVVTDTLPNFLDDVEVTEITIGGDIKVLNEADFPGVTTFGTNKRFEIPWAGWDGEAWSSKYGNNTEIVITYTAVLTDIVRVGADNTNTVTISPKVGKDEGKEEPREEKWEANHSIKTYAAAIKKVDGEENPLAGAKFKIPGLLAAKGEDGVYTVVKYTPGITEETMTDENTSELVVDKNGMIYIVGLKDALNIKVVETEAPAGYNMLTEAADLTTAVLTEEIYKTSGYREYDEKGNIIAEYEEESEEYTEVTKNLSYLDETALPIENNKGTELPSTGGIGTTIFYVAGAILILGAGVLLITRRRMKNV